jgi:hypothetical protein
VDVFTRQHRVSSRWGLGRPPPDMQGSADCVQVWTSSVRSFTLKKTSGLRNVAQDLGLEGSCEPGKEPFRFHKIWLLVFQERLYSMDLDMHNRFCWYTAKITETINILFSRSKGFKRFILRRVLRIWSNRKDPNICIYYRFSCFNRLVSVVINQIA